MAIDPGPVHSAYVVWDGKEIEAFDILLNQELLKFIKIQAKPYGIELNPPMVIEQIRSYGMPVGATIFDTVFWSGRFYQAWRERGGVPFQTPRIQVKQHICHDSRAKDSNIIQALVDRFAYGKGNRGKGTKKEPGFFYGFKADVWQAFALAVTWYDLNMQ